MAILEDINWNIAHIQNAFIIDQSGTCEQVIHARDQRTVSDISKLRQEAKNNRIDWVNSQTSHPALSYPIPPTIAPIDPNKI